jgi:hypothetical protein
LQQLRPAAANIAVESFTGTTFGLNKFKPVMYTAVAAALAGEKPIKQELPTQQLLHRHK